MQALEAAKRERENDPDEIETQHPGYLISQDTFYVGYLKGVGRIYQQSVLDTYSSVAFAKLYSAKIPVTSVDILNDRVLLFFEEHNIPVLRVLTDRGTEYCGSLDKSAYQLYLQLNDIDHTKTKVKSPQTNGICERFILKLRLCKRIWMSILLNITGTGRIKANVVKAERRWGLLLKVSCWSMRKVWSIDRWLRNCH